MSNIIKNLDTYKDLISALFSLSGLIYIFDVINKLPKDTNKRKRSLLISIGVLFSLNTLICLILQYNKKLQKSSFTFLVTLLYFSNTIILFNLGKDNYSYYVLASFSLSFLLVYFIRTAMQTEKINYGDDHFVGEQDIEPEFFKPSHDDSLP